jgi:catechol 2,3-dioxygenase-like lactoylglutathione lyase family enzyme
MTPRIDLIGLVTTDMAASLAFYRRLGLDLPPGAEQQPHVEAVLPGGLRMAWDTAETIRTFDPDWRPGRGGGLSAAFRCESPAAVDALYAELTAAGHTGHRAPWDAFWGQRYAVVLDPDGNGVDLFAPLAGTGAGEEGEDPGESA